MTIGQILDPTTPAELQHLWDLFPLMHRVVPAGRSGEVQVVHSVITEKEAICKRALRNELWTACTLASLKIGNVGWMFDTLHERAMNETAVTHARGHVLIAGLGLGMILHPILAKPEVETVTVLENSPDVMALVMPSLDGIEGRQKLAVIECDAKTWAGSGTLYDSCWLDVVPGYGFGPAFMTLHEEWMERYWPFMAPGAWVGHWGYEENLIWMISQAMEDGKVHPDDERPYPIGPPDKVFIDFADERGMGQETATAEEMAAMGMGANV